MTRTMRWEVSKNKMMAITVNDWRVNSFEARANIRAGIVFVTSTRSNGSHVNYDIMLVAACLHVPTIEN